MQTTFKDIEILIVGAGTMGASLAQNYAQNGFRVGMLDISEDILNRGFAAIEQELAGARGRIFSDRDIAAIRSRIAGGVDYEEACSGPGLRLVVEAATERLDIKQRIFETLDRLTHKAAVLATNSSSLDTNVLAAATRRPDRVVWMHYFYLPHKNRAGEYAGTDTASDASKAAAHRYLKLGGKIPTHVRKSRKGGVADVIFVALLLEATRMLEEGFNIADIEAAGRSAYGIPIGFLALMDATGIPVGLYSMQSFSDASRADDPLYQVYGNFYAPRENYIDLTARFEQAQDKSTVRWIANGALDGQQPDTNVANELADRFLAVGCLTAAECVDAGLISIEDLELLAQNAFLWQKGPFTIMRELGPERIRRAVSRRAELAKSFKQDFPVSSTLRAAMGEGKPVTFQLTPVVCEAEAAGAIRRITLCNPKASNAMDNSVFAALRREFAAANADPACKVIIFDTAPIKSFIAGADIKAFVARIRAGEFDAIRRDTADWQDVMFHVMTGTTKPKVAIIDGQAFGGGVEVAAAFALDPNCLTLITNRTTFALPETRLGIYPGLRGTLTLPQLIYRKTGNAETAVAFARYYILAGGMPMPSPQVIYHLGLADAIVPQQLRDHAAGITAEAIIANGGMISATQFATLPFERLDTDSTPQERQELQIARDLFLQADLLPTLYAQAGGHLPLYYSGEMKGIASRMARRVAGNSPHAIVVSDYLIARGMEGHLAGRDNDALAEFELEHHLRQIFEHPDALIGLEALLGGRAAEFRRRYPF